MRIPLPGILRRLRDEEAERGASPPVMRTGLQLWSVIASRPWLYRTLTSLATRLLASLGRRRGCLPPLPFTRAWTRTRDLASPAGATFQSRWQAGERP